MLRAETSVSQPASAFSKLQSRLDMAFTTWLKGHYTPLGAQGLPFPHHVHHMVHYLNYRREQGQEKVALIVLDGLALMDWLLIRNAWQARHLIWHLDERLLLAQVPTITSISRQALVSGLRPADFAASIQANSEEPCQWETFWMRAGLPAEACAYVSVDFRRDPIPAELSDPRLRMLCLVERTIDEIVHGSVLGNADLIARLKVWLDEKKNPLHLESVISDLLGGGFDVFITSDHGHTEAIGIGQPNEGILAQTRSRRVRIYSDRNIALHTQNAFQPSLLWEDDGLLPNDLYAIFPGGRGAFVPMNQPILTHGGISLDEVIVPFIEITHV
ncbi:MAG: BREX-3 system phosphatase PglZ [Anaerolineales bacterium]